MRLISLPSLGEILPDTSFVSFSSSQKVFDASCETMGSGSGDYGSGATAGSNAAVLGALGTLIGYLGTEISVNDLFERLLWPQRYYNSPSTKAIWKMAFTMPMGGPLHKASLQTLDTFYKRGLFKGNRRGHMLGTAFFGDTGRSYRVHERDAPIAAEHVRNGMWVRVLDEMPMLLENLVTGKPQNEDAVPLTRSVRQQIAVSHLYLRRPEGAFSGPVISHDTGTVGIKTIGWLVITEMTGIIIAIVVVLVWKSAFMIIWLLPLLLKVLSACFSIPREGLVTATEDSARKSQPRIVKFEITPNGNGFQVIEGEESLVVQFFRHFGHPIRSRSREILQIAVVTSFGLLFPFGLLCSLLWMPTGMQYMWLSYQLYTTIALHVYHFADGHHWATTEEKIAQAFRLAEAKHENASIVFGTDRSTAVHATLVRTVHDRFGEGQAHVSRLLADNCYEKQDGKESSPPSSTTSSGSSSPNTKLLPRAKPAKPLTPQSGH